MMSDAFSYHRHLRRIRSDEQRYLGWKLHLIGQEVPSHGIIEATATDEGGTASGTGTGRKMSEYRTGDERGLKRYRCVRRR